jgi:hypothetical protein
MSINRFTDDQRKVFDIIQKYEKEKTNEFGITYKELKNEIKKDIRSPLGSLLTKKCIRISGFKKDKNNSKLSLKNLLFETRKPHKSITDIIQLFKGLESTDPYEYKNSAKELIEIFLERIREYESLENEVIDIMADNVFILPLNSIIIVMECIKDKYQFNRIKNVDDIIDKLKKIEEKENLGFDKSFYKKLAYYLNSYWPKEDQINSWKKLISKNNTPKILFLKTSLYANPLTNFRPLSGNIPFYRLKKTYEPLVDDKGELKKEDYLSKSGINKIHRRYDEIINLFYKIIFYIDKKDSNMLTNAFMSCLTKPLDDNEIMEKLIIFDKLIKKVEYVPENPKKTDLKELDEILNDGYNEEYTFKEEYDLMMSKIGRKESDDIDDFFRFTKEQYSKWKSSN